MGKVTPSFSGNNLPSWIVPLASKPCMVSRWRSCTRSSSPPQPGTDMLAATLTFAKSASVALACATAAQPPSSLKPDKRSSFTHSSAHFGWPSSLVQSGCSKSLSGFRMPTMTVTTLDNVGLPFTDRRLPSFTTEYTPVGEMSPFT